MDQGFRDQRIELRDEVALARQCRRLRGGCVSLLELAEVRIADREGAAGERRADRVMAPLHQRKGLLQLRDAQSDVAGEHVAEADQCERHNQQGWVVDRFADLRDPVERALDGGVRGPLAVLQPLEGDERMDAPDELEVAELLSRLDDATERIERLLWSAEAVAGLCPPKVDVDAAAAAPIGL